MAQEILRNSMTPKHQRFLDALAYVESGWYQGKTETALPGDGGFAIGDFQIHSACWQDAAVFACRKGAAVFDRDLLAKGTYWSCLDHDYAEAVAIAYLTRWAPQAWDDKDWRMLARIWNGGPAGAKKQSTVAYADRVIARMASQPLPE